MDKKKRKEGLDVDNDAYVIKHREIIIQYYEKMFKMLVRLCRRNKFFGDKLFWEEG